MLNKGILKPEIKKWIKQNLKKDLPGLILKGSPFPEVTIQEIAIQIKGLKVAEKKYPTFFQNTDVLYPPKLNLEQTSSEITAKYKAALIKGDNGIDLTGGLGIDTYFISRNFKHFKYCERNAELARIAEHNFKVLEANNIQIAIEDGIKAIKDHSGVLDWVYADPARRDNSGGKVFKLGDCEPDIPKNLVSILAKSPNLMLKTSPVLDISLGLNELKYVKEIHIIAIGNEVKELLWIIEKDFRGEATLNTINFETRNEQIFSGSLADKNVSSDYILPEKYLYEPNAAIMKSGLFDQLALQTGTNKLHQHSHLYTSTELKEFPGRKFEIVDILDYKPAQLKRYFKARKGNITTRNFPESVESLRKRFKLKDGGSDYIFFTTNKHDEKIVIFCKKV